MSFYRDMGRMNDNEKAIIDLNGVDSSYLLNLMGLSKPEPKCVTVTCDMCFRRFYMPETELRCSWCMTKTEPSSDDLEFKAAREMLEKELGHNVPDMEVVEFVEAMKRDQALPEDTPWPHGPKQVFKMWLRSTGYCWSYGEEKK